VLPLDGHDALDEFFAGVLIDVMEAVPAAP
jgi:hypothetical protein